jgi:hypothetical protein
VKPRCRTAEVQLVRNGEEIPQLPGIDPRFTESGHLSETLSVATGSVLTSRSRRT